MGTEDQSQSPQSQQQQQQQPYGQQPYGQYYPPPQQQPQYQQPQQYQYQQQYQPQFNQPVEQSYQQQQQQPHYAMPLPPQQQPQPQYHHDQDSLMGGGGGQQPPSQGMYGPEDEYEKFPMQPPYRDLPFGIAFLAHLALLLVITISAYSKSITPYYDSHSYIDSSGEIMGLLFVILPFTIIFCVLFLFAWMRLAKGHGEGLIRWSNAVGIIQDFPSTLRLSYAAMLVNFVCFIYPRTNVVRVNRVYEGGVQTCINIYLVFSLYWTFQVIKNTLHTTISGLFATWYFQSGPNGEGMPPNPTLNSFRRATTTSFGSICFGSLVIAVIQTLRYITQLMMNNKNGLIRVIGLILNILLGIMEAVLSFFNIYVFTHVAIYGESYVASAKRCGNLFAERLGSTIINDNFIGTTISISAFAAALLLSVIGSLIGYGFQGAFYGGILTFVFGLLVIVSSLEVVYSGVVSLFVCYVLNPSILYHTKPELYAIYSQTYSLR
ncbi:hypothetical protein DICPUDRAFT_147125 [Dictyostelium purpureum]|uniref:Choline transporter-like protein n=1 Tax=Dictyostelium purpureum TaxID=5786 RepID=F0Z7Q5_DICPU|nr:uncharacterized protein DICPUDRAFT_147125 [Dictyostelium purpureum]EGC40103.1 hypothetical protein DICPUDRAFT_147125 [Dictyostelium purpureum]|eukprot:XP_003283452.1 hypothetical protein DICPUDRAFT_147125 [Dictyostelium purpureum]